MSELDRSTRVESMEGSGGSWFDRRFYSEFRLSLLLCVVALLAFISLFEGSSEPAVLFDGSGGLQPNSLAPELLPSTSIHQDIREIPRDTKLRLFDPQLQSNTASCERVEPCIFKNLLFVVSHAERG